MKRFLVNLLVLMVMMSSPLLTTSRTFSQQIDDPDFDPKVARPAYSKNFPQILIDEAHANFHTAGARYKPLADLLTSDGYQITSGKEKFSKQLLKGFRVLVIANALAADSLKEKEWSEAWFERGAKPAFTDEECDAVRDWIQQGGSLLLIADHAPFGGAAEILARRFNVEMSKGYVFDKKELDREGNYRTELVFSRENGGLLNHAITQGRDASERVNRILTFVGQSLKGPAESSSLLRLSESAIDRKDLSSFATEISAAGRSQAVVLKSGKGRVVVLGEAAMLTAQVGLGGKEITRFGMNVPGSDNRQLALNIMHWLSGLLE